MVEDGRIEFLLRGVVSEDHRFGNAGSVGNFPGRGTAEALLRKKTYGDAQNLESPILRSHARPAGRRCLGQRNFFDGRFLRQKGFLRAPSPK